MNRSRILEYNIASLFTGHNLHGSRYEGQRKFQTMFGATAIVCSLCWQLISDKNEHPAYSKPNHLLCTLLFLRLYAIEKVHERIAHMNKKTFRNWSCLYFDLVSWLRIVSSLCNAIFINYRNQLFYWLVDWFSVQQLNPDMMVEISIQISSFLWMEYRHLTQQCIHRNEMDPVWNTK